MNFSNYSYVQELFELYSQDPESVDSSWKQFFDGYLLGFSKKEEEPADGSLLRLYRTRGHLAARSNPLNPHPKKGKLAPSSSQLEATYEWREHSSISGNELATELEKIYCSTIGFECELSEFPEISEWLYKKIEEGIHSIPAGHKKELLENLAKAELFESFIHKRYPGQKRFSVEGNETSIAILNFLVHEAAHLHIEKLIFGMSHRGRLNALAHVLEKPYREIFAEFETGYSGSGKEKRGDVKYHKGYQRTVQKEGHALEVSLAANPSHLESVDAVVQGIAKATQHRAKKPENVLPVLLHGDAAFAGQGVVYETFQLSRIHGYSTKGTIHLVVNNQIGYTASERESRSTRYCTDIAKTFSLPVFHVNAEDPEVALYAMKLALEVRQTFGIDVILDVIGYRKYGHNETDEPSFTNPALYQTIQKRESIYQIYKSKLISEGVISKAEAELIESKILQKMDEEHGEVAKCLSSSMSSGFTKDFAQALPLISDADLRELIVDMTKVPESFVLHPKIQRWVKDREGLFQQENPLIDWALAEHLAYGSLLVQGTPIRISGQDSIRGTFSHRHAAFFHQETEDVYFPLHEIAAKNAYFHVFNSCLSEYAVMGFEYGYTLGDPKALVIWEGQFGDFANGAEIIIDQYIAAGEAKWGQQSGIVLYLPHGYEGMGPEHSSARMERFLQLAADDNMRIVYPSTPAQWFHVICLATISPHSIPTICFTPKEMLRHKPSFSFLSDLSSHGFEEVIDEPLQDKRLVQHLLICTGKVYYDLLKRQQEEKHKDVALLRIEQLYPFPEKKLSQIVSSYPNLQLVTWVQEEHQNMGAYTYIEPHLRKAFSKPIHYAGREASASPATGSKKAHEIELKQFIDEAFRRKPTS